MTGAPSDREKVDAETVLMVTGHRVYIRIDGIARSVKIWRHNLPRNEGDVE
jgi:hypothetical protein